MKSAKKILSVILAVFMLLGAVPLSGFVGFDVSEWLGISASAASDGYYTYSVSDGKATITDVSTSISGDVTIPSTLGGYPVTSIGYQAFYGCTGLTSITISNSVTSIVDSAFYGCSSLTSITIPDGVTYIGDYAFYVCSSLTSITIPDGVTYIGKWAFFKCNSLTSITIPDGVTYIGGEAFELCSSLTSITIPDSVTSIGNNAFYGCSSLASIKVASGNSVYDSRNNCNAIIETASNTLVCGCKNTVIPDSVTSIGNNAFYVCSSLASITIPDSVTSIGNSAFYGCNLKDIYFTGTQEQWNALENRPGSSKTFFDVDNEYSLVDGVLYNKNNTLLVDYPNGKTDRYYFVQDGVRSIGTDAFADYGNIYSVILPEGLKNIGASAFYKSSIRSIYIPSSITTIESSAFGSCSYLTDIYFGGTAEEWQAISKSSANIPSGVTMHYEDKFVVKDGSVYNADGTQLVMYGGTGDSFTLPDDVVSINKSAFANATNLKKAILNDTVTKIDSYTFDGCTALTEITIPSSVTEIGKYAFRNCSSLPSIAMPGVGTIGNYAFNGCTALETIALPCVGSIGNYAFDGCTALESVSFASGLTSIGHYAFNNCTALVSVDIPDTVNTMGGSAFWGCAAIKTAKLSAGVTTVPANAFSGCVSLKTVYIPETVTGCNSDAFSGATVLEDVYFGGSDIQWDAFNVGSGNNVLYAANIHYAHVHEFSEWTTEIEVGEYTDGMESRTCATCGYKETVVIPCGHEHSYVPEDIIPASCYDHIVRRFTCVCGKSYDVQLGLKGHNLTYVPAKTGTCIENGNISHYFCADCGGHFANSAATTVLSDGMWLTAKTEHKWVYDRTESDSCTEPGTAYYYCSVCEAEHTEQVTVGHSFTQTVVESGCLSRGYTLHVCNNCEYSYTDKYTPALGHMDLDSDKYCDICGEPVGGGCSHDFEFAYTPATCTSNGSIKLTCKLCDKVSEEIIPATEHNYVDFVIEPTCTAAGYTKHYCINCGDEKQDTLVKALGHSMRTQTITPTCTEQGCDIVICENCGYNYEDNVVAAAGHKAVKLAAVAPSCSHTGLTEGEYCSVCNEVLVAQSVVPECGHTYVQKDAKKATDTEPGYTGDTVCSGCGNVLTPGAVIPAGSSLDPADYPNLADAKFEHRNNGNNWDFWYENETFVNGVEFAVTQVTSGTDFDSCADKNKNHKTKLYDLKAQVGEMAVQPNGDIWIALPIPGGFDANKTVIYYVNGETYEKVPCFVKDGKIYFRTNRFSSYAIVDMTCTHATTETVNAKAANCKATGYTGDTVCTGCGKTIKTGTAIAITAHSYSPTKTVAPTCTEKGYTVYTCSSCSGTKNDNYTDALGHAFSGDTCTRCGNKCSCNCHKSGFSGFIWKILCFFYKLFGIKRTCDCGAAHY